MTCSPDCKSVSHLEFLSGTFFLVASFHVHCLLLSVLLVSLSERHVKQRYIAICDDDFCVYMYCYEVSFYLKPSVMI